jgi:hypothetical protein
VDAKSDWAALGGATVGFYVASPRLDRVLPFSHLTQESARQTLLGIGATNLFEVKLGKGKPTATIYSASVDSWTAGDAIKDVALKGSVLELAVPLSTLGALEAGDDLRLTWVVSQGERDLQSLPATGPARVVVPELNPVTIVLAVNDLAGDDNGPGTYTYPTDGVLQKQVFDLKTFSVGYDEKDMVFKFVFYGPVPNPWGSPNNLAVQTLDVYVDKDPGAGTGARRLLPGRNAVLPEGDGWDYAVWAEGWSPQFIAPDAEGQPRQVTAETFKVIVDPASSTVTLRVPRSAFGEGDPTQWGYVAAVMSQDGFPASGVWRVRDGEETAGQRRFGGVPKGATNYPRILDLADTGDQAKQLAFTPSTLEVSTLTPDDFAQVSLLKAH